MTDEPLRGRDPRRSPDDAVDDGADDPGPVELLRQRARRAAAEVPRPGRLHLRQPVRRCVRRHALVDRVVFREPIRLGELVTFDASVNFTGRTSMEIGVRVRAEDVTAGTERHTNSCYVTMVAVRDGRPIPVPPLRLEKSTQRRRAEAAKGRRDLRVEMDRREAEIRHLPG